MVWLLNWLWQGVLLTAVVAAALACARGLNAATRERIWWITLAAVLVLPFFALTSGPGAVTQSLPRAMLPGVAGPLVELPEQLPAWTVIVWLSWLTWSGLWLLQLAASARGLLQVRRRARPFPAGREADLPRWKAICAAGHPGARLGVSDDVPAAAVLGCGFPIIAISPAIVARLTWDELDQVIAHEYAHVERRDHFAVLVQRIAWAAAGFHPAVWWLDRALTLEREVACDDRVLGRGTEVKAYSACLIRLAETAVSRWSPAPGAVRSRSQTSARVVRLLDPRRNPTVRASRHTLAAATLVIMAVAWTGGRIPVVGQATAVAFLEAAVLSPASWLMSAPAQPLSTAPRIWRRDIPTPHTPRRREPAPLSADVIPSAVPQAMPAAPGRRLSEVAPAATDLSASLIGQTALPSVPVEAAPAHAQAADVASDATGQSPWLRLADAGVSAGDGFRAAGVRTGGAFTRLGRSIASAF